MPAQIQDFLYSYASDLTPQPLVNQQVFAVPSSNAIRLLVAGSYRFLSANVNITSPAFNEGIVATTDPTGQFSLKLPYGATETKPTNPNAQWSIVFPDSKIVSGVVPSVAGPLLIDDLITTYSWVWTSAVAYMPPTSGVEARGTAVFTSATSANIVFLTPMVSSTYVISYGVSEDTTAPGFAPNVWWSNKTTTGFTINTNATYTGFIDWVAKL